MYFLPIYVCVCCVVLCCVVVCVCVCVCVKKVLSHYELSFDL